LKKLLLIMVTVTTVFGVTVENEIKLQTKSAVQSHPAAKAAIKDFVDGKMFYDAMPAAPSTASTAVKVIETDDHTDFICKIYKLKTKGVAAELVPYLKTTVEKEKGRIDVSINTATGDEYIIITAPVFQFPYLESVINMLDEEGVEFYEDGTKDGMYKLKNRLASDVAEFAEKVLISKEGSVLADDRINKIYMCDSPSYYYGTINFIEQIDVPPEMVRIEAQIVEIEMDDDFNFGLALEAWKEGLPENVDMTIDWGQSKENPGDGPAGWARYVAQNVQLSGMRPKAMANFINYLVRDGKAKILSCPTVVAMNGEKATIASLDNVNYKAYSQPEEPLNKQAQVGISLTITPIIGSETLSLNIDAAVNSVVGWSSGGLPVVNTRSTSADVVLKDGELFTLSGLKKDMVTKVNEGVPVLGSIPLIGYFFRHEIDIKKTSEIVVFLTPKKVVSEKNVKEREKELLNDIVSEIKREPKAKIDKLVDRVILNK